MWWINIYNIIVDKRTWNDMTCHAGGAMVNKSARWMQPLLVTIWLNSDGHQTEFIHHVAIRGSCGLFSANAFIPPVWGWEPSVWLRITPSQPNKPATNSRTMLRQLVSPAVFRASRAGEPITWCRALSDNVRLVLCQPVTLPGAWFWAYQMLEVQQAWNIHKKTHGPHAKVMTQVPMASAMGGSPAAMPTTSGLTALKAESRARTGSMQLAIHD